ncbi:hypothetical protein DV737_g4151, partial [Chaetothyriales sp. CBS 132003]
MSTATHAPVAQQAPPPVAAQQSQGPGLFGQMASTAAGVAVGSSIGHAVGGLFGGWGGSSQQTPEAQQQPTYNQPTEAYTQPGQAMDQSLYNSQTARNDATGPCAGDIKSFTDYAEVAEEEPVALALLVAEEAPEDEVAVPEEAAVVDEDPDELELESDESLTAPKTPPAIVSGVLDESVSLAADL